MTASPPSAPEEGPLPGGPPPLALLAGLALVTRYRLRLTDAGDSRLGPLGGAAYELGAAAWTGPRAAFVGFYTPPAAGSAADLEARLSAAHAWAAERLRLQGAERCEVLLVALGPLDGPVAAPGRGGAVRVGAVTVRPGAVEALTPLPGGLPSVADLRGLAGRLERGEPVPTLAAVDLAERQTVAGGYVAPTRGAMVTTPYVAYGLVGVWVLVQLLEEAVFGKPRGDGVVTELTMGGLPSSGPGSTDWWRYVASAFLHDHRDYLHIAGNGFFMVIVGGYVERLYGRLVLLGAWLLSAAGANLLWVLAGHLGGGDGGFGIGASGGNFGLLGLIVMLGRVQGRNVPAGVAGSLRQYAVTLALINIALGFALPHVNNLVHLFGFACGIGLGLLLPPVEAVGGRRLRRLEVVVIVAVLGLGVVALGLAAHHLLDVLAQPSTAPPLDPNAPGVPQVI